VGRDLNFSAIFFDHQIAHGLGHFVLKFGAKIRRGSRGSCKLNTRGGMKNWRFRTITRFTAKTVQDTAIVTMEDEYKLVCDLSNGVICNDLE